MEKYENLGMVGEGSYGMVIKCRHKESQQYVAIKKFLESEDDRMVKKIAMREIRMLKQLRHENLVNLIEVFRRKKRLYLVFEFVDRTILEDLEKNPKGIEENNVRKIIWQVLKGIEFCHVHNIVHRDIKPENILISRSGVVKICDFGFARTLATHGGEPYTEYVATRWYRAPELLVGDKKYGRAVDIWAIGCLTLEMLTGDPLFPGDSDIDQLFHIIKCFGSLHSRHVEIFRKNPLFIGMRLPEAKDVQGIAKRFPRVSHYALDMINSSLKLDSTARPTCSQLLRSDLFIYDTFSNKFPHELKIKIQKENQHNPLLLRSLNRNKEKLLKEHKQKKEEANEEKVRRKLPDPLKNKEKTSIYNTKEFINREHLKEVAQRDFNKDTMRDMNKNERVCEPTNNKHERIDVNVKEPTKNEQSAKNEWTDCYAKDKVDTKDRAEYAKRERSDAHHKDYPSKEPRKEKKKYSPTQNHSPSKPISPSELNGSQHDAMEENERIMPPINMPPVKLNHNSREDRKLRKELSFLPEVKGSEVQHSKSKLKKPFLMPNIAIDHHFSIDKTM